MSNPNTAPYPPSPGYGYPQQGNKSFLVTWLLSLLVGVLGVDRFYLGKIGTGLLKLVTLGGFGIWALVDLIFVLTNKTRDKQGLPLEGYDKNKKIALIVTGVVILLSIVFNSARAGSAPSIDSAAVSDDVTAAPAVVEEPTVDPSVAAAEREAAEKAKAEEEAAAAKAKAEEEAAAKAKAKEEAAAAAKAAAEAGTVSQQNAKGKAADYLEFSAFSRSGLIKQLEFEKFSAADATWAVDKLKVDWNAQAALKAKEYLEYQSFSRAGLVDQLMFEGFTAAQAEFGVSKTGL